jgi:hypothetical protein
MNRRTVKLSLSRFRPSTVAALLFGGLTVKLMCVRGAQKFSLELLTIVWL